MNATRRLSLAALAVACLHLVFGAIVRISGSGMGCGDHWPKCYGYWFPPFNRPDLIVEVSHRYLASILTLTVLSMAFVAWRNRRVPGVGGKGGAMRSAFGAVAAVFSAALLGGLTVKMGNAPWATVAHWLVAMTLLAMVATTAIRSGALGGASSLVQQGTQRARRSGFAAAGLAIFAVALGGLTAKYPGAAVGCTTVPMCGPNPAVETASVHVQITHRTLAVLLVLHLFGVVMMVRKRRAEEAPVVFKAAHIALGMVLLQLVVASSMVLFHLPPVLRSLHEATGVGIWLSCFTLAYLARRASKVTPPEPATLPDPSPKGGISITREPVAVATVIAATETLQASAPVPEAGVAAVEDVAVVQETPVAEETAVFEDTAVAAVPTVVEEMAVFEQVAEPQPAVFLSEANDPLVAEEILEIATEEAGLSVAPLPEEEGAVAEAIVASEEKLPPALEIVAEVEIVEPEPVVVLSESKDPFAEDIITVAATEVAPVAAERSYEDVTAEAAIVAELILAIEDAAKEAALESAVARAEEAAIVAEAIAAIGPLAEITAPEVEEAPAEEIIEIAAEEIGPSVAAVPHDDSIELALPQEVEVAEDLDWEPHRAQSEELDEFSIAALEAEVAALEAAQVEAVAAPVIEAVAIEPEPVVESTPVIVAEEPVVEAAPIVVAEEPVVEAAPVAAVPTEQLAADASVIVPPVKAPKVSPIPAPTMAVLVARGADFL